MDRPRLVHRLLGPLRARRRTGWVTPFVVTRHSAPWIVPLLTIWRDAGLEPFVLLDDRSTDGTDRALRHAGFGFRRVPNAGGHAEPMVAAIARERPRGWLFRIDDDEVPSAGLLDLLAGPEPDPDAGVTGFARRTYVMGPDGRPHRARLRRASYMFEPMRRDWQYRLFRAERVEWTGAIHTPGFVVPEDRVRAPASAYIAHFVWVLRTLGQRRAKLLAYEREQPSMGTLFADMYVPEDARGGLHAVPAASREFDAIARIMAGAAGHG